MGIRVQMYFSEAKIYEREMALPNRMSLRPGLLWLTFNRALIIQCLSRNNVCFQCNVPRKMSSRARGADAYPRLKTNVQCPLPTVHRRSLGP
jgi:hypothetical protein